jgi:hypothetical protein
MTARRALAMSKTQADGKHVLDLRGSEHSLLAALQAFLDRVPSSALAIETAGKNQEILG